MQPATNSRKDLGRGGKKLIMPVHCHFIPRVNSTGHAMNVDDLRRLILGPSLEMGAIRAMVLIGAISVVGGTIAYLIGG